MSLGPYYQTTADGDQAFTMEAPKIKFGSGSIHELGDDSKNLGMTRVALFTDPVVGKLEFFDKAKQTLIKSGCDVTVYDETEVEPTDRSFKAAAQFAGTGNFDGFVSVGGGSTMDTCKAANLYSSYPDDFLNYVNAPIGDAKPVPGPLKPHIACPTTFGTASECTAIAVFDLLEMEAKTGIANARLRPNLGLLDPDALATLPTPVLAANGFDVFSHAVESLTARPYTKRPAPLSSTLRPISQGANPYSDLACQEAIRLIGTNLVEAVNDRTDKSHNEALMFAGMLAGIGFGNAGCHLPHAMSYAVAGLIKDYHPEGWPDDHVMAPHGISVIVNAPSVFRMTGPACPERHLQAARAMGADMTNATDMNAGDILADRVIEMMRQSNIPNGLNALGYDDNDVDALVEKTLPQKRLTDNAAMAINADDLKALFKGAMSYW